jgi:multidrug efflux pump subunit AcrA (membrane-fusion protein)
MPVKIWRHKGLLINGALAVVLVVVGVSSYLVLRPASKTTALATSSVQQGTVLATVSASGTLEAAQDLGLNFTTGGKVTAIYVKVGQRVKAGQKLAKVDATSSKDSLEQARAELSAAEAQLGLAAEGETPQAKKVQGDQAVSSQAQIKSAESTLSAAEQSADDDATSAEQSVTTAQDTLGYAEQTLSNDETKLSTDEGTLNSAESKLDSDEAAETTACAGSTTGSMTGTTASPSPSASSTTSSACATAEATVATDKTTVSSDQTAVSSDQTTIDGAEATVTGDQNSVKSAQDSEKSTEDHDKATVTADKEAVTSAENSYQTTVDTNTESSTPNASTISQDASSVTNDEIVVQEDQQTLDGTTLTAPFAGTVASISSDVGDVVSSSGGSSSSSSGSSGSGSSGSGSSGSGSSSSSSSSSSSGEAASGGSGAGTGEGGAGTTNSASGFIVLTNLSNLLIQATFDETDAASLRVGAAATVTPEGVTGASALSATVAEIDPTSTTSSGVVDYGVTLALTGHASGLKSGESVSVSVITGEANNALYVPATAVTTTGTSSTVTLVGTNNAESAVPVTLGVQGSTDDQILSGLVLGEKVLTSTATTGGTGTGGFPFRGGGGIGGGIGGGLGGGGRG